MFLIWPSRKDFNGCKKQSEDLCTKSFSASPILFSASPTLANIAPFDNTFVWIQNSNQILFTIAIYHIGSRSRCHCWHPQNNDQEARYYLAWSLLCRDPGRAWSTKSLQFYHLMNKRLIQNDRQRYIYIEVTIEFTWIRLQDWICICNYFFCQSFGGVRSSDQCFQIDVIYCFFGAAKFLASKLENDRKFLIQKFIANREPNKKKNSLVLPD